MSSHPFYVRCYARCDAGQWVAVCIDLGLAAQGETWEEVKGKLEAQVNDYVHEALTADRTHANDLLRRKAPLRQRLEYYLIWLGQAFLGRRAGRGRHAFEELVPVAA